jgi:hypothetical protein
LYSTPPMLLLQQSMTLPPPSTRACLSLRQATIGWPLPGPRLGARRRPSAASAFCVVEAVQASHTHSLILPPAFRSPTEGPLPPHPSHSPPIPYNQTPLGRSPARGLAGPGDRLSSLGRTVGPGLHSLYTRSYIPPPPYVR